MITKKHIKDDINSEVIYSDCERYRYSLSRIWDSNRQNVLFVMLNPSTADEFKNDPTVERCERRARMLNFGAFCVCNIFAWRETNPHNLIKISNPIGKDNNLHILRASCSANLVICAWGVHGKHLNRDKEVTKLLLDNNTKLYHLGLTKENHPKHPLYIPYSQEIIPW